MPEEEDMVSLKKKKKAETSTWGIYFWVCVRLFNGTEMR